MELGKSEITVLSRFFRDESKLLLSSKGKLKQWLEQHFDLYHNGKGFVFDAASKEQLRSEIELSYPRLNMRAGLPSEQDRIAISQYINNEKLADIKPSDHHVLVKSHNTPLMIAGDTFHLPQGTSLRLAFDDIDFSQFASIIIVENLDVFDVWHKVNLQLNIPPSLIVYRGHEHATAKGLKLLLANLPNNIAVIMFADLDPKGLEIALTTERVIGVLAPSIEDINRFLLSYSQASVFLQQHHSLTFLAKQQTVSWQSLVDCVLQHKLAVMQQVFVALNLPLICYK
jgi:hypothetical protein